MLFPRNALASGHKLAFSQEKTRVKGSKRD
jgi:hypothetical protein